MANEFVIKNGFFSQGSSNITGSLIVTGGITGSFSGSGTVTSASFASTASYVLQAVSASYATNGGVTQIIAGPNITVSPTTGVGQVTISSTGGGGGTGNTATGSYGSFYDTTIQTNVASTARSMSLNTTDITNGVSISGSTNPYNTYIKTENAGVYDIQFSAQVDKTDSGTDEIWIWLRKNGSDVTDSATSIQLVGNGAHYVAAWNFFVNAAANDYFQLMWYSPDANVRLHAEAGFGVVPGIPSLIVTANRVDQFLSNTGSFSGSFTGTLLGTASYATQALSASFASTASFIPSKTVFNQPILGTGNIGFVTRSFTQGPNVTGTTSEVQVFQLLIPSNTFIATDKLTFFAVFNRATATGTVSLRAKMSTSSSMPSGNTSLIARLNPTANNLYAKMARDMIISGGNIKGFANNSTANNDVANSTAAMSSQSLDVTVDNYFYLSVQPATGSDEIRLEAVEIKNI